MEILSSKNYQELLDYLPRVKSSLKEWLFIEVRLTEISDKNFSVASAAALIRSLFGSKEGKLYICNSREILMLLRWAENHTPAEVAKNVEQHLPAGSCEVEAHEPTPEGLIKLVMRLAPRKLDDAVIPFVGIRNLRKENIILVADSDIHARLLIKESIDTGYEVYEVAASNEVLEIYKKCAPDILFLDLQISNTEGSRILRDVLTIDPKAYIVMMSSDSALEKVKQALRQGAKGFLTKPFTRERLQDYIRKCPTIT